MVEPNEGHVRRLTEAYVREFQSSAISHARSLEVLVDGISHGARTYAPFPLRIVQAQGAWITDTAGHRLLDYWQGHYANILGHNPPEVTSFLIESLQHASGLQTGLPEEQEIEYCELLAKATGSERVRLTTSGTLATMYALMIARAHTGRKVVVKVGGGWHGANPLALKGVAHNESGYDSVDSAGVSPTADDEIIITCFNDVEALERVFASQGDRIAAFIFEPCPSVAGFIPASRAYMETARRLTYHYGASLILDEVITGFRYCASGVQRLYGIQADISTYGKIIGGGMPIAAVTGRDDLLSLTSEHAHPRVWFNGGTYSAHPLSLTGGLSMLRHLVSNEQTVYEVLARRGRALRQGIERVMAERGILARCTADGNEIVQGGSLSSVYFPKQADLQPQGPDDLNDPRLCDVQMRETVLKLGLLLHGVNVVHGLGALSMAHGDREIAATCEAFDRLAEEIQDSR
ncbi:MAG: aminotransferase class III-fold pyridoxal phosphate-dependent enzyme [Chloroflexi bacterium]|nr:aminotransferase class III-fold pyridoxal phosphate-dependent enzyme [Chloroflexota bacterium]